MTKSATRKEQFAKAVQRLDAVLSEPKNEYIRDSAIQRFEFVTDLAWKTLQAVLEEQFGLEANAPKTALRMAHENGLVEDIETWLMMVDDRNLTSHTYDEELAERMYERLPGYRDAACALMQKL